jgi:hypothetical protein
VVHDLVAVVAHFVNFGKQFGRNTSSTRGDAVDEIPGWHPAQNVEIGRTRVACWRAGNQEIATMRL